MVMMERVKTRKKYKKKHHNASVYHRLRVYFWLPTSENSQVKWRMNGGSSRQCRPHFHNSCSMK